MRHRLEDAHARGGGGGGGAATALQTNPPMSEIAPVYGPSCYAPELFTKDGLGSLPGAFCML